MGKGFLARSKPKPHAEHSAALQTAGRLLEHGLTDDAERVLDELVRNDPRNAAAHGLIGILEHQRGRFDEARAAFERSLALDPAQDRVLENFGFSLLAAGNSSEAIRVLRECTRRNPNNLGAWMNLGLASQREGEVEAAARAFASACRIAPDTHEAWNGFVDAAAYLAPAAMKGSDGLLARIVEQAILRDDIDASGLTELALALLKKNAAFDALYIEPDCITDRIEDPALPEVLASQLFISFLSTALVADAGFERLAGALRRALTMRCATDSSWIDASTWLPLVRALAGYCFYTEYVLPSSPEEQAAVASLLAQAANERSARSDAGALRWALIGCYRPLADFASRIPAVDQVTLKEMIREQVIEPQIERQLCSAIPALTPITDPVSQAVRAQYEENPYPRWRRLSHPAAPQPLKLKLRQLFPHATAAVEALPERTRTLIAGCGTGQHALTVAMMHPHSRLLAIDLSRTSLAYALRRARELGAIGIEFAQADILGLGVLDERFDVIEAAGVLHHLRDPLAGWRVLRDLLELGGFMRIALYSEQGRRDVIAARAFIEAHGFPTTAQGIPAARAALQALPKDHPASAVARSRDFYSMSGCRDLLFHVEEHRFTIARIACAVEALGIEFIGFEWLAPGALRAYREMFPADPSASRLENWSAIEARYPALFASMYQFWVCRPE